MKRGTFPGFCHSLSNFRIHADPTAQARSDPLETEADRMADWVLADPGPAPGSAAPPRITSTGGVSNAPGEVPASVHRVLQGAGSPLSRPCGATWNGPLISTSLLSGFITALQPRNSIVFGARAVATDVGDGRGLLAHELTHVVQQCSAASPAMRLQRRQRDPDEAAAITKEETDLAALAKRALASQTQWIAVQEVMWRLIKATVSTCTRN
jgi:hypothetical protein